MKDPDWLARGDRPAHHFEPGAKRSRCGLAKRALCTPVDEHVSRCALCVTRLAKPIRAHSYVQALNSAITQARVRKGMTLAELARKSGVAFHTLRCMASMRTRENWPSTQTVHHVALALGLAPSTLLQWAEEIQRGEGE